MAGKTVSAKVRKAFSDPLDSLVLEIYSANPPALGLPAAPKATAGPKLSIAVVKKIVTEKLGEYVAANSLKLKKLICVKLRYCELIESEPFQLAKEIADVIAMETLLSHGFLPVPPIRVAAYFVRTDVLSKICNCNEQKTAKSKKAARIGAHHPATASSRSPLRRVR